MSSKPTSARKRKRNQKDLEPSSYCLCGYDDGEMIFCESGDFRCVGNHWYHFDCLALNQRNFPRGKWICPTCAERARETEKSRKKINTKVDRALITVNEENFVLSKSLLPSKQIQRTDSLLKVTAAERQSREMMESIFISARLLQFNSIGQVIEAYQNKGGSRNDADIFPGGLCRFRLSDDTLLATRSLHRVIVNALEQENRLTPWAGVAESDARKRGYAFLPSSLGHFGKKALTDRGVQFHAAEKRYFEAKKDEASNWQSCVRLSINDITENHMNALNDIIARVRAAVPLKYKSCIALDKLQALQPNLHRGLDHLPAHLDSPLHDGFGVVIVTVCVHESADILLLPSDNELSKRCYAFEACEGDVYVLSGDSRNIFDHGVLCPHAKRGAALNNKLSSCGIRSGYNSLISPPTMKRKSSKQQADLQNIGRESLNLRFDIHGNKPGMEFFVGDEIPLLIHR